MVTDINALADFLHGHRAVEAEGDPMALVHVPARKVALAVHERGDLGRLRSQVDDVHVGAAGEAQLGLGQVE